MSLMPPQPLPVEILVLGEGCPAGEDRERLGEDSIRIVQFEGEVVLLKDLPDG